MIKNLWQKHWVYLVALILCGLVMLPRLLDSQFGLMDDGDAYLKTNLILNGQWGPGSEVGVGESKGL